jgi:antitoxin FitA
MPTITIRHVPDEVRNELAGRAARSGRSLQEYMLREVTRLASKPSTEEFLADVRQGKDHFGTQIDPQRLLEDRDADRR